MSPTESIKIGGMRVDCGTYAAATEQILNWSAQPEGRYVCIANVHMVMEAYDSESFRQVVNGADMVTSDGMPLVWLLRSRGYPQAERVYGPTLMLWVCAACADQKIPIAFFGGTTEILAELENKLLAKYPSLNIAGRMAPPFGTLSADEINHYRLQLAECGARVIFVGLGCPKQERLMAIMRPQLGATMLGVGAAFNFHAGKVRQSPAWMQRLGLEWLFRLAMEPRRLWRRYLILNPRFIWLVMRERWTSKGQRTHPREV